MMDGVVIVNITPVQIIDKAAMAPALDEGNITAAGLGVFMSREPELVAMLMGSERALLVQHLGTHTVEMLAKMESLAMRVPRGESIGGRALDCCARAAACKSVSPRIY
jgi:lactate dehydrogenase-like 2-hydroxyacid dehydrogenase